MWTVEREDEGNEILLRRPLLVFFGLWRIMKQQARSNPLLSVVRPAKGGGVWWGWARKARRNLANTWPQTSFSTGCILARGWGIVGEWGGGNRSFTKSRNSIRAKLHRASSLQFYTARSKSYYYNAGFRGRTMGAPSCTASFVRLKRIFYFLKAHLNFSKVRA